MTGKPFFRAFDGCWYAQIRVGGLRKQVKLFDRAANPHAAVVETRRRPGRRSTA